MAKCWTAALVCFGLLACSSSGESPEEGESVSGPFGSSTLLESDATERGEGQADWFSDGSAFALASRPDSPTGQPLNNVGDECGPGGLAPPVVRRLSRVEYLNTLEDLLGHPVVGADGFSPDAKIFGFENNARALGASPGWVEQIAELARRTAEELAARESEYCQLVPSCTEDVVARLGTLILRRPLGEEERERFEGLFAELLDSVDAEQAIALLSESLLQSPSFLYRELPLPDEGEDRRRAVPYAIASRLSYLLWQSMPDESLFASAANGRLLEREEVLYQARRMLQHPRALGMVLDFHRQWLGLERVLGESKMVVDFPDWNMETAAAAVKESIHFIEEVFVRRGGSVRELLTTREAVVNEQLAALYDVPFDLGISEPWQSVQLPDSRAGLLTRVAFLAGFSHPASTSPPLRGVAVLDKLLCSRPPPAPASANTSTPLPEPGAVVTTRDLFEQRTAPDACQGCHKSIDGIGMAFEQFDTLGRFRLMENDLPIDASGQLLLGEPAAFDGVVDLSQRLASSDHAVGCAVTNLYRSAFGQTESNDDACRLRALSDRVVQGENNLLEAVVAIAVSEAFLAVETMAEEQAL